MAARGQFSTRFGFVMAAAGSAVGLGNIWGFPTQTASYGGGAFVLVYFLLAMLVAYPALMAEMIIGRYKQANVVSALSTLPSLPVLQKTGFAIACYAALVAGLILSFYTIVAGWMLANTAAPIAQMLGQPAWNEWLTTDSSARNIVLSIVFSLLTMAVIARGIENGIEAWSKRLMPILFVLLFCLIAYVLTLPGAIDGLKVYLIPNWSKVTDPGLILGAMGQAFFSLSLGVGTMLIYGSYLRHDENVPQIGLIVTLVDTSVAFVAGLLVIPAMYVAQHLGTAIYASDGSLIGGPSLIFQILPTMFDSMGQWGTLAAAAFFALMSIAALTSSISMLEVPVSVITERTSMGRLPSTLLVGTLFLGISLVIVVNFDALFGFVVDLTTKYSEPLLGIMFCLCAGWLIHRNALLATLKEGNPAIEHTVFWKIWPFYIRFICPLLILAAFIQTLR